MKKILLTAIVAFQLLSGQQSFGQAPPSRSSAEILQQLKKLNTLGSVLYIAAHPDDENTRLLTYLSKEMNYRTGYLSLTRGDGGQNLIGDEQGIELGLIRTQELLAARRVDGAEQFFTRAYDFGFSKNPEETFRFWDKDKVLADVVYVIRKFRPDVIITRFPTTGEGGHGHHTASAILAGEAFEIAGDPSKYPEQLKFVQPWKPKRLLWNTFNFGSANTISEDQFKIEVGQYNPLLGKSYGEIAAESRSQHKSQGFGVPRSRGEAFEYFRLIKGTAPVQTLTDGVVTNWGRVAGSNHVVLQMETIIRNFNPAVPSASVPDLVELYRLVQALQDPFWKEVKLAELRQLIAASAALWLDATTSQPSVVPGTPLTITVSLNKRLAAAVKAGKITVAGKDTTLNAVLANNTNVNVPFRITVPADRETTQPYWLKRPMGAGYFDVREQQLIGLPQNGTAFKATVELEIEGLPLTYELPVMYKYTDPVKGEIYQPLQVVPPVLVKTAPDVLLFRKGTPSSAMVEVELTADADIPAGSLKINHTTNGITQQFATLEKPLSKGMSASFPFNFSNTSLRNGDVSSLKVFASNAKGEQLNQDEVQIQYDHIPVQHYFYTDSVKILNIDLKTVGKKIGYIPGAGDKVVPALRQMGYEVVILKEEDLQPTLLRSFDAVITGVRAHNVHAFLSNRYEALMDYVKEGGNLIVQYNTNNQIGPVRTKVGPYPFTITRNRVTDETADVAFLKKDHPVLNHPNTITSKDFEGWVQERGIYFADQLAPEYETILSMKDPGEPANNGSLIVARYGKGTFVYTGLVFFRQLPAGVPGAYRLLANIIALNQKKPF
ncbi:MAG: PIG-L family deacetylase [Chitinophagaceae bacterium]